MKSKVNNAQDELTKQNAALVAQLTEMTKLISELRSEIADLKKLSQKTAPALTSEKPREEGAWVSVKVKGRKASEPVSKESRTSETVPVEAKGERGLELRDEDWPVKVLKAQELCDGAEGVAMMGQVEGERLYKDLVDAGGKMAIVTPRRIEEAGDKCRELIVKAKTREGRLVMVKRCLTNIGDKIKGGFEKRAALDESTLTVGNHTQRMVLKVGRVDCHEALYPKARMSPKEVIDGWLIKQGVKDKVLYMSKPIVKNAKEAEWIESVIIVKDDSRDKFHKLAGKNGVFVNIFRDGSEGEDLWRVVRFEKGTSVDDALAKALLHPNSAHGLVWGPWGIGVRVPKDNFQNNVHKLFGAEVAKRETDRIGAKMYEIGKVPPWVEFDDLSAELKTKWGWSISLCRIAPGWNSKRFIVRANEPPKRDAAVIDGHWLPIQEARSRDPTEVRKFRLKQGPLRRTTTTTNGSGTPAKKTPLHPALTTTMPTAVEIAKMIEAAMKPFMEQVQTRLNSFETAFLDEESEDDKDMEAPPGGEADIDDQGAQAGQKRPTEAKENTSQRRRTG